MPEWQASKIDGTPAEQAVHYVLQRVVNDRNFSWYMIGTQTLRLCIQAEAARTGKSEEAIEAELHEACQKANVRLRRHGADTADVCLLRLRVEELEVAAQKRIAEEPPPAPRRHDPTLYELPERQWWEEEIQQA